MSAIIFVKIGSFNRTGPCCVSTFSLVSVEVSEIYPRSLPRSPYKSQAQVSVPKPRSNRTGRTLVCFLNLLRVISTKIHCSVRKFLVTIKGWPQTTSRAVRGLERSELGESHGCSGRLWDRFLWQVYQNDSRHDVLDGPWAAMRSAQFTPLQASDKVYSHQHHCLCIRFVWFQNRKSKARKNNFVSSRRVDNITFDLYSTTKSTRPSHLPPHGGYARNNRIPGLLEAHTWRYRLHKIPKLMTSNRKWLCTHI